MWFKRKKIPIAWRVEGDKMIPIDWDEGGRIAKAIEAAIKYVEENEKRGRGIAEALGELKSRLGRVEVTF